MTASAAAAAVAYPARQVFRGQPVIHAVAAERISAPGITLGRGEPLCRTFAELLPCEPGLFGQPITCSRCIAVTAAAHVTIGEQW